MGKLERREQIRSALLWPNDGPVTRFVVIMRAIALNARDMELQDVAEVLHEVLFGDVPDCLLDGSPLPDSARNTADGR